MPGAGHDFNLWPEYPFGDQVEELDSSEAASNVANFSGVQEDDERVAQLAPRSEPVQDPGTSDQPAEPVNVPMPELKPAPVPDESFSRAEYAARWGPGPGGYW